MGKFPNKATQFSKENQPDKNGRKRKIYTILTEHGYSADDIKTAFSEMGWNNISDLKAIYEDETKPILIRIIANQFFQALKKSDWNKIKEILEHVIGKPQLNISTDNIGNDFTFNFVQNSEAHKPTD